MDKNFRQQTFIVIKFLVMPITFQRSKQSLKVLEKILDIVSKRKMEVLTPFVILHCG